MATPISTQKSTFQKTTTQMAVEVEENGGRIHDLLWHALLCYLLTLVG